MDFFGSVFSDIEEEGDYDTDIFDALLEQLQRDAPEDVEKAKVPTKSRQAPRQSASQADIFSQIDKTGYNVQQTYVPFASQSFQAQRTSANQSMSAAQLEAYWLQRLKGFVNG